MTEIMNLLTVGARAGSRRRVMRAKHQAGFTLIEVMIVLVIVAILAAVAVPSYQNSVQKSRRADAKAALSWAAAEQEKWLFQNNQYFNNAELDSRDTDGDNVFISQEGHYEITVNNNVGVGSCVDDPGFNCYTLTATAVGAQADDGRCTTLSLTHTGVRTATGTDADNCW